MKLLYIITAVLFTVSLFASPGKTLLALKDGFLKLMKILPVIILTAAIVSVILYFIPEKLIARTLVGKNIYTAMVPAALLGSVSLMPGFITFPLCGILLTKGVPYTILSIFTTTLMLVGVATYPLESRYFGVRVTLIRNAIGLCIAFAVALATGIFFGELL